MTHTEACDFVRELLPTWQERLRLRDWNITLEFVDAEVLHRDEKEEFFAWTTSDPKRMEAIIELATRRPRKALEDVLVHELVHVLLSEMAAEAKAGINGLGQIAAAWHDGCLKTTEERAVLRIVEGLVGRKRIR